jgi:hypothetical protein
MSAYHGQLKGFIAHQSVPSFEIRMQKLYGSKVLLVTHFFDEGGGHSHKQ